MLACPSARQSVVLTAAWGLMSRGAGNMAPEIAMRAKQFFYIATGLLLLVVAYSVGAHQAGAQAGG